MSRCNFLSNPIGFVIFCFTFFFVMHQLLSFAVFIKDLEAARGKGTSMISHIMPPHDQIAHVIKMLVMSLELLQT